MTQIETERHGEMCACQSVRGALVKLCEENVCMCVCVWSTYDIYCTLMGGLAEGLACVCLFVHEFVCVYDV